MLNMCTCQGQNAGTESTITTISLADLKSLSTRNSTRLTERSITITDVDSQSAIHTTADGGVFLTTSSLGKLQGDISLAGTIGPLPVELHLSVKVDGDAITVTLELDKPIHLGPYTWTFKLGGIVRDAQGAIIGAQSVSLSPETPAFKAAGAGSHFLCILKCAGLAVLPILIGCLPSLSGGLQGFIACVVGKAGTAAASIAACVGKCVTD